MHLITQIHTSVSENLNHISVEVNSALTSPIYFSEKKKKKKKLHILLPGEEEFDITGWLKASMAKAYIGVYGAYLCFCCVPVF